MAGTVKIQTSHEGKFYSDPKYLVNNTTKFPVKHGFNIAYNDRFGNKVNVSAYTELKRTYIY